MKKQSIQVRDYTDYQTTFENYLNPPIPPTLATVNRKLYAIQIGNFCPVFCRYQGKTYQVQSKHGDLSDPFRADETYLETLYIDKGKPCQWNL
jgi:hypothetical protein